MIEDDLKKLLPTAIIGPAPGQPNVVVVELPVRIAFDRRELANLLKGERHELANLISERASAEAWAMVING